MEYKCTLSMDQAALIARTTSDLTDMVEMSDLAIRFMVFESVEKDLEAVLDTMAECRCGVCSALTINLISTLMEIVITIHHTLGADHALSRSSREFVKLIAAVYGQGLVYVHVTARRVLIAHV